jgi:hypothetical protein
MEADSCSPTRSLTLVGLAVRCLLAPSTAAIAKNAPAPAKRESTAKRAPGAKASELPQWVTPPAYSVDMVMESAGTTITMKRYIQGAKIRSEISAEGTDVVMIELGDEAGTIYTLMSDEKMAMKMSTRSLEEMMPPEAKAKIEGKSATSPPGAPPANAEVEFLGDEKVDGVAARKYRVETDEGVVVAWFDAANDAPLRMESKVNDENATIKWKNLEVAPQPDKLYEIPKDYEVQDMDEMVKQMQSMTGMPGGAGLTGLVGGAAMGQASGMASKAGSTFGAGLGAGLGATVGGPLGAMAGQYIGGAVGGWVSKKVVDAVVPGK